MCDIIDFSNYSKFSSHLHVINLYQVLGAPSWISWIVIDEAALTKVIDEAALTKVINEAALTKVIDESLDGALP